MREIKFRGLRVDGEGWVCGCYVQDTQGKHRIYWKPFKEATSNTYHFVTPESVGQLTGLQDKNGVDIYEGDIVIDQMKGFDKRKSIVEWDSVNPCFVLARIDNKYSFTDYEYDFNKCDLITIQVIGNIHEAKEVSNGSR